MSPENKLFHLPNELIVMILLNLSDKELENLCSTTKDLDQICNLVWQIKYENKFGKAKENVDENNNNSPNWKELYHKKMVNEFSIQTMKSLNEHFHEYEFGTIQRANQKMFELLDYIYQNKELLNLKKLKIFRDVLEEKLFDFLDDAEDSENYEIVDRLKFYLKEIFNYE
jgi:hypothetical protein